MDQKFCSACGQPLSPENKFCPGCGSAVAAAPTATPAPFVVIKKKIPGRGLGVTSLVMGILAIVYCTIPLISLLVNKENAPGLEAFSEMVIFPVLAITFGGCALGKKYQNGISVSGLILGILGLLAYGGSLAAYFLLYSITP